jgi:hypothetical protein
MLMSKRRPILGYVSHPHILVGLRAILGAAMAACLVLVFLTLALGASASDDNKAKEAATQAKKAAKEAAKEAKNAKEAKDSITVQADAVPLPGVSSSAITLKNEMTWSEWYQWLEMVGKLPMCVAQTVDKDQAYIFHVAHWVGGGSGTPPRLVSSSWSAYGSKAPKSDKLVRKVAPSGDPLIYGKRRVLLISFNIFDDNKNGASTLSIRDKSSVTQGTPANAQALAQLVTSLLGLSTAARAAQGAILVALDCQEGTAHLPFDLNVVETIGLPQSTDSSDPKHQPGTNLAPGSSNLVAKLGAGSSTRGSVLKEIEFEYKSDTQTSSLVSGNLNEMNEGRSPTVRGSDLVSPEMPQDGSAPPANGTDGSSTDDGSKAGSQGAPKAGQADCSSLSSKNTCTVSRTFTSLDKEWWDVSLAISVPGVRESKYSISSGALQSKPTTHTDMYALFDMYWSAKWWTKNSGAPHVAVGLPVTGQTFYRPAFGFAGVVYMKTTAVQDAPTTAAELTADSTLKRVWKPIFGVEVPVSSLISKIGKSSKGNNTNGSGGGTGNQGSTSTQ